MDWVQSIFGIMLVFGLLGACWWAAQKRGQAGPWLPRLQAGNAAIQVESRLLLTPQHQLHLIHVQERTLLIATHPQGSALLLDLSDRKAQLSS